MAGRKPGRPSGDTGAREAILEAARRQFGDQGYQRTTLRSVATRAAVDPRLVLHYFGSKAGLFEASIELPVDPSALVDRIFMGPREGVGLRAAEILVGVLEDAASRRGFLALLRAAVADPDAAASIRGILADRLLVPISRQIGGAAPEVRAAMLSTLLVGIAIGRYVVAFEPMTAMTRDQLVRALVPVIHHYLFGDWANGTRA